MLTDLLTKVSCVFCWIVILFFVPSIPGKGQDTLVLPVAVKDTVPIHKSTLLPGIDSLLKADTARKQPKKSALKSKVDYLCTDSLRLDIRQKKVFLYKDAEIKYEDINLKADYVEIDFQKNEVFSHGLPDSTGKIVGVPEFTQGDQKFKSKIIRYNYNTKKGFIQSVFTKQDQDSYLHAEIVKKMENDVSYMKNGSFTSCDLEENPHYAFHFGKAKVIPGKRVITGPAYMVIAQVPTPLMIPFGYFPSKAKRQSGILIPTYGESANKGFFLQGGGYYWAMSKYTDLALVGDIYSRGSWAVKPTLRYNYRYHYNGTFNFSYAKNILGVPGSPDYDKSKDFRVFWIHNQDPKARPRSNFSANVNISSTKFNKNNLSGSTQAYLSNQFNSSINYSTNWNSKYYLNLNLNHSQNTLTKTINFTLPQIAFSVNQFYPFRRQKSSGKLKWYENISMKYNLDAENRYATYDSLLFAPGWQKKLQNGVRHVVPISATITVLKYVQWTNSINLSDKMYLRSFRKRYVLAADTAGAPYILKTDTIPGFVNAFNASATSSISTKLYGMYQFKRGPIMAIRHMMTPSVGITYVPNFGDPAFGYWQYIQNDTNHVNPQKYSIFPEGMYDNPPSRKSGIVSFSLRNNLEMKVRNRKDTITGTRKIMLIEDLVIGTAYDLARDSLNWSNIGIRGNTTLFKNLRLTYSSSWDLYARDAKGNRINKTEWQVNHRLLRMDNSTWNVTLNYTLSSETVKSKKNKDKTAPPAKQDLLEDYDDYVDFDIPWSFTINYNFSYGTRAPVTGKVYSVTHTVGFNGQLNITPKWKISLNSGYDFIAKELSYTRIDITRDLHCWEMRFGWTPKGYQQSWDFSINVKASLLQDLKLNKKKDFRNAF